MRARKAALWLYFAACILAVIGGWFQNDALITLAKPITIPAIAMYYLSSVKGKMRWAYIFFLLSTFIGDTIVLMHLENQTQIILVPYAISYLILIWLMLRDVVKLKFDWIALIVALFVFILLLFIAMMLIGYFTPNNDAMIIPVIAYGLILGIQAGLSAYHYYSMLSNMSFYMAMTALFNCVSDIYYVVFTLILSYRHYLGFDLALQLFSYYFVVKYFIFRQKYILKANTKDWPEELKSP